MASNGKNQPSISRFFAPLKSNGLSTISTDEKVVKQMNKTANVNVMEGLKRSKSSDQHERNSKKFKPSDADTNGNCEASPKRKISEAISPLSASTMQKLNVFRASSENVKDNQAASSQPAAPRKGGMKIDKSVKLTPLEQQVVAIKEKHPDILLFVECGYKYRFFGEDAEIASKELNIMSRMDHNFLTGSIPTHRLHVHVRRLVAKGYKVGVVKQTETAALKAAGGNKTAPFTRELSALYTRSTLIGEDVTPNGKEDGDEISEGTTSTLMILNEFKSSTSKLTGIAFVAIQPTTGEIVYDFFDDTEARLVLWSRLENIQPIEVVISKNVSDLTKRAITAVTTRHGDCIRIEELSEDTFEYSTCLRNLCMLFESQEEKIRQTMNFSQPITCCLGATLKYLEAFNLEKIIKTSSSMVKYSSENHIMILGGPTLRNLEIVSNTLDGGERGSLFWVLNRTNTKFGARMLRQWVTKPLLDAERIRERQEMVNEFLTSQTSLISTLKELLHKAPDFERALTTIFYKRCSPYEFLRTVKGLTQIHRTLKAVCTDYALKQISSHQLQTLLTNILNGLSGVLAYDDVIDEESAKENKKTTLLRDWSKFSQVIAKQKEIKHIENELHEHRKDIAQVLSLPSFTYTTVSGLEYLIEVKNNKMKCVPPSWNKVNMTKTCSRFRTPQIEKHLSKLFQFREQLQAECNQAWLEVLESFCANYQAYRESIKCLGMIDAILSLAKVAQANGYCKPEIVGGEGVIEIVGGKHPIVNHLLQGSDQFVPNDSHLHVDGQRVMLVTGPNMGGKSCYMRQVALITLMAQVGSYVPAQSARLSIIDGIYTRMGATDQIFSAKSTFMVELCEMSDIMKQATSRSLVILDELGRGTSTQDGLAIAMAVLDYFINKVKCFTIFVTHYLPLTEFEVLYPGVVGNFHMSFLVSEEEDQNARREVVTFLYQLTTGSANKSYGLNVAHLANMPQAVVSKAAEKSTALQTDGTEKQTKIKDFQKIFGKHSNLRTVLKNL